MFIAKRLAAVFLIFFLLFTQAKVFAADINLPHTTINPDKYLFFSIKRLVEKGIFYTKLSKESKVDYLRDLTLTRTAELKYVVENKLLGEVERSTQRLSYQVGALSDFIVANAELQNKKQNTVNLLDGFKKPLATLRDQYPANSSFWMLVQHSINSIDLNLEKLK